MTESDTYRFKTGDELACIFVSAGLAATPEELRIACAYTAVRAVCVADEPQAHTAWLVIGGQRFQLEDYGNTPDEAAWFCWMLAKSLLGFLESERKGTDQ